MRFINILLLTLTLFTGSCIKEKIVDSPSTSNYIQSESDLTSVLNGAWGHLQSGDGEKFNGFMMRFMAADDLTSNHVALGAVSEKKYISTLAAFNVVYARYYMIINNCNFILENLANKEFNADFEMKMEGEARFLRAWAYFTLVRYWGGVPLVTTSTTSSSDFFAGRNTVDEVYALITADLKTASSMLKVKSVAPGFGLGRTNKGAAQALLSLVLLTNGNYHDLKGQTGEATAAFKGAVVFADSVILSNQYSLLANYADLWPVDKEAGAYQEVIFGIPWTRDLQVGTLPSEGSEFASKFNPVSLLGVTASSNGTGAGMGQIRVQPYIADTYTTGEYTNDYRSEVSFLTTWLDTRLPQTFIMYAYPAKPVASALAKQIEKQPYITKYKDPKALDFRNNENDLFVIRLAEVYLIKAEAENEVNGPTAAAYDAFNKVRERARKANGIARSTPANLQSGLSKNDFRFRVFNERSLELIAEGQRWFDLVRMKSPTGTTMFEYMYSVYIPSLPQGLPVWNASASAWQGGRTETTNIVPYNPKFLLFPLPSTQIELNPNFTQNPGY